MENTTNHEHNAHHDMHHKVHAHASKLESVLADFFKNFPHLPEGGRKFLVDVSPYVPLVFGILGVIGVLFGGVASLFFVVATLGMALPLFLTVIVSLASAVLLLMSYKGLLARSKQGWNYAFYSQIVSVISGLIAMFTMHGGIIGTVVGAIIGFYILFEIREHYK